MAIKRSTPDVGYFDPEVLGSGMSNIVRVGDTVYLSGIVAAQGKGQAVAVGDMAGQIAFILDVLRKLLATEGMTLANVVSTTTYCVDMDQLREHGHLLFEAFTGNPPTSTWIEVSRLASPEYLLELVVVAAEG